MEELVNNSLNDTLPAVPSEPIRGRFRKGDPRINLEGRPRGSKAPGREDAPGPDIANCADRLMLLFVPIRDFAQHLSGQKAPWVVNLPLQFEIAACRVDESRNAVALTIRSKAFPRIARGAPIPEFQPRFNGLMWRRG